MICVPNADMMLRDQNNKWAYDAIVCFQGVPLGYQLPCKMFLSYCARADHPVRIIQ